MKLDSLRWFSQRHIFGVRTHGGYDPNFELGRYFCTMQISSFYVYSFGSHRVDDDDDDDEIAYFIVRWKTRASFVYRTKNMR